MEVLAKTAVAEMTKLVGDESAGLRLEMSRNQRENEALKTKLLLVEGELRDVRGYGEETPCISLNLSFEVQVCDEFRETQRRELHTGLMWSHFLLKIFFCQLFICRSSYISGKAQSFSSYVERPFHANSRRLRQRA